MEKGRTQQIIDMMSDMIDNGQTMPLSPGKVMIPRDDMSRLLRELTVIMETELRAYRDVTDKKGKIITAARKEAEDIIYEAEHTASRMRVSKSRNGVSPVRLEKLDPEDRKALNNANEIYAASIIYTDEMLTEVNKLVEGTYASVKSQYNHMIEDLEEKLETIKNNKKCLMDDLSEMKKEDRYEQILEISQILSNELYIERMKHLHGDAIFDEADELDKEADAANEEEDKIEKAVEDKDTEDVIDKKAVEDKDSEQVEDKKEAQDKEVEVEEDKVADKEDDVEVKEVENKATVEEKAIVGESKVDSEAEIAADLDAFNENVNESIDDKEVQTYETQIEEVTEIGVIDKEVKEIKEDAAKIIDVEKEIETTNSIEEVKEVAGKEVAGKEVADNEVKEKEVADKEITDKEITDIEIADKKAIDSEVEDSKVEDKKIVNKDSLGDTKEFSIPDGLINKNGMAVTTVATPTTPATPRLNIDGPIADRTGSVLDRIMNQVMEDTSEIVLEPRVKREINQWMNEHDDEALEDKISTEETIKKNDVNQDETPYKEVKVEDPSDKISDKKDAKVKEAVEENVVDKKTVEKEDTKAEDIKTQTTKNSKMEQLSFDDIDLEKKRREYVESFLKDFKLTEDEPKSEELASNEDIDSSIDDEDTGEIPTIQL